MNRLREYFGDDWELLEAWLCGMAVLIVAPILIVSVIKLFS